MAGSLATMPSTTCAPAIVAEWRACSCDHLPPYGVGVAPTAAKGLPTMAPWP